MILSALFDIFYTDVNSNNNNNNHTQFFFVSFLLHNHVNFF